MLFNVIKDCGIGLGRADELGEFVHLSHHAWGEGAVSDCAIRHFAVV